MTITPIKTPRVYREIVDQLANLIARGEFAAGQQLPSEHELVAKLGVSRASVREALVALEIMGLIETRAGQGRFVCSGKDGAPSPKQDRTSLIGEESPFVLLAARKVLEPAMVAEAAKARSEEHLASICEAVELAESSLEDSRIRYKADRMFQASIAAATENPVIQTVMEYLSGMMSQRLWRSFDEQAEKLPGKLQEQWAQHREIFEAIEARDPRKAARSTYDHLEEVNRDMLLW